jgi:hypothetical protein
MNPTLDHRGGKMMRAGHDVGDELGVCGIRNRRLEDSNDGGSTRIKAELLPDH